MSNVKNILFVVAHSDDESIGAGGALAKHVAAGNNVKGISLTNGVGARKDANSGSIRRRELAARLAAKTIGFDWLSCMDFGDNRLDAVPILSIIQSIEKAVCSYKPDIIYTHSKSDLNIDHEIVARAVLTVFRPGAIGVTPEIRLFEVPSATDFGHVAVTGCFSPNLYVDISDIWNIKRDALEVYGDEMRAYPHSRSIKAIENLARVRGSQVGLEMAEAYMIIRRVER